MDPVGYLKIIQPVKIFVHHCLMNGFPLFFLRVSTPKNLVAEQCGEFAVAQVVKQGTVHSVTLALLVPLGRRSEGIHEGDTVFPGDFSHRLGVEGKIFILLNTIGDPRGRFHRRG